ncbi:uncharacterized protein [Spinacia oleracea]|uniref:Uncharacterized protein n=1 Tax=Spinacia oleracea TaxID=3562 RepID=A0ABM3QMA7_SPIOL|nr:uncharacterized protein LOC110799904 [Spinacia oleracea]
MSDKRRILCCGGDGMLLRRPRSFCSGVECCRCSYWWGFYFVYRLFVHFRGCWRRDSMFLVDLLLKKKMLLGCCRPAAENIAPFCKMGHLTMVFYAWPGKTFGGLLC